VHDWDSALTQPEVAIAGQAAAGVARHWVVRRGRQRGSEQAVLDGL
jgi:hypothetical protein